MKSRKYIFLMTTISSLLFSCTTTNSNNSNSQENNNQNDDSSQVEASSSSRSQTSRTSMPSFNDLDHVKLFVAKSTNSYNYTHAYAWTGSGNSATQLLGAWPGTALSNYDDNCTYQ